MHSKFNSFFYIFFFLFISFAMHNALAAEVGVAFDPIQDDRVVGYKLYYGTTQNSYAMIDLGPKAEYNFSDLQPGATYYIAATAYDSQGNESDYSVPLSYKVPGDAGGETPGACDLLVSTSSDRSNAVRLDGWSGTGEIYVFIGKETGISRVSFFLDDPSMKGSPYRVENYAPYDLRGGSVAAANPFDATRLSNDWHTITALVELTGGGSKLANAVFSAVSGHYLQDSSSNHLVSIEAENFDLSVARSGHEWRLISNGKASKSQALQAAPDTGMGCDAEYVEKSPRVDFAVNFKQKGVHYVWVRGYGPNSQGDSLHVGLDGRALSSSARIHGFDTSWRWSNRTMDGARTTINIAKPGIHNVNVWMREDGFVIDKLVLTTNPNYVPSGTGPAESLR